MLIYVKLSLIITFTLYRLSSGILLSNVHRLFTVSMVINSGTENSKRRLYAPVTLTFLLYDIRWLTTYCTVKTFGIEFKNMVSGHHLSMTLLLKGISLQLVFFKNCYVSYVHMVKILLTTGRFVCFRHGVASRSWDMPVSHDRWAV